MSCSISDESLQLVTGQIFIGQAVLIAHDLGVFKLLSKGSFSIKNISKFLKLNQRAVQAIISSCCAMGLVDSKDGKVYQLSQSGQAFLNKKNITYYGEVFDILIKQNEIMNYKNVKMALLTNRPQVDKRMDIFSNTRGLGNTRGFVKALHQKAIAPAFYWAKLFTLNGYSQFVDIGGGSGIHTIAACLNNPLLKGVVCDREPVLVYTKKYIQKFELEKRITLKKIDMWKNQLPMGDIYFLSDIFHDWEKEKCVSLARQCFKKLAHNGLIILHEMLFNESKTGPFLTAAYNMKMMLWTRGQQFSGLEIQRILRKVGFQDIQIIKSLGNWSLIVGKKNAVQ